MNIAQAIIYLFPNSDPMKDFVVLNKGPEPVIRAGSEEKGKVRYEIAPVEEGEEEVEGVNYRYVVDYNLLIEGEDYDLVDKGQVITYWNIDAPIPSNEMLEYAWKAYLKQQEHHENTPSEIEEMQKDLTETQLALADTYEQLLKSQNEVTSVQEALVEVYEELLLLMSRGEN